MLAGVPRDRLTEAQRTTLDRTVAEYVAAEQFNADRPESHVNLALLHVAQQQPAAAEAEPPDGARAGPALHSGGGRISPISTGPPAGKRRAKACCATSSSRLRVARRRITRWGWSSCEASACRRLTVLTRVESILDRAG